MSSIAMFEFTEEDLQSNKRGFISPPQKVTIKNIADSFRSSSWSGLKVVVFFLFFGLCVILSLFLSSESYRALMFKDPLMLIILALTVPVVLGIYALGILSAHIRANQLENSELKKVEGTAKLDEEHSSAGPAYYVIIEKVKFGFPEEISKTFREGKKYRIFYCETIMFKHLLSFEKVD